MLGTPVQAIINTEDRELFADMMRSIGVKTARSEAVNSIEEALKVVREIGYPVIVRAAYTLGGLGSGFCSNDEELKELASSAFTYSPQILIEESLKGWKEIEYEVVRDLPSSGTIASVSSRLSDTATPTISNFLPL